MTAAPTPPNGLHGQFTETSYTLPDGLSYDEWAAEGPALVRLAQSAMWWLGDWWNYGERRYGDAAFQAAPTGRALQTVQNAGWVAASFEPSRRREDLTFGHHEVVAARDIPEDEADELLEEAAADNTSVMGLRAKVKHHKAAKKDQAEAAAKGVQLDIDLYTCSVQALVDRVEHGTVDVIITDPPYPREHLDCYLELSITASKLLRPGGLCVAMAGQSYLPAVIERLGQVLNYHWCLAYMTPGESASQYHRKVNTFWKPVLVYANGDYDGDWFGDVAKSDENDKTHHEWGQSEPGMFDLIRRFSNPGDLVCDPFVGGGTTAVVCAQVGRRFVGCDIDEQALERTRTRLQ